MNKRFFELARKESYKSNHEQHKLGSVLIRKGKVIGIGHNKKKTHTKSLHPFKMIHAEFAAILDSKLKDFSDCALYIYRETPGGRMAEARPCIHCQNTLKKFGIIEVYYTSGNGFKTL